jgi:hypothetical protein
MTNNAERELLPCPFCGGKAKLDPENPELEGDAWTQVHCANAECSVDPSVECFEDGHKESAIRIWNTRAQASGVPVERLERLLELRHVMQFRCNEFVDLVLKLIAEYKA